MRIFIEQSGYHLNNMGDVAMLQIAISRLRNLWPDSEVWVVTTAPETLKKYCPNTFPVSPNGRNVWASPLTKYPTRYHWFNKIIHRLYLTGNEQKLRRNFPLVLRALFQILLRNRQSLLKDLNEFTDAFLNSDLVVLTGGGYINDIFPYNIAQALTTLELATGLNKPTAMLGHGLGPLQNPEITNRAKAVLPLVNVISLREKRAGIPLLNSLGVASDRIITTGDDAVELAYKSRKAELGNGIGVNLRVSHYSGVNTNLVETVKRALHTAASTLHASLVPVPISRHSDPGNENPDGATIQQLLQGYPNILGGYDLDAPQKVVEQASFCRVVVTASYHAAVFALSQGIPAITLVNSEYYADKFLGLAEQFGGGCEVLFFEDEQLEKKLTESINQYWREAENLRPNLLSAAERQIELGYSAYQRVYELVSHSG